MCGWREREEVVMIIILTLFDDDYSCEILSHQQREARETSSLALQFIDIRNFF